MENAIIVGILIVVAFIAVRSSVKHFAGKGECCGGTGTYKPRRKKLKKVVATKTFRIEGMHCENCSNRVAEVVNDIPHVAGAVHLKKGLLTVSYEQEVADEVIREKVERAGYQMIDEKDAE